MRQTVQPRVQVRGNKASKTLKKSVRVGMVGETPRLTGEFTGETHRLIECTENHLPRYQHQKNPICLLVAEEVTEGQPRAEQVAWFPLRFLPHIQHYNAVRWVALPWGIPKAPPLTM